MRHSPVAGCFLAALFLPLSVIGKTTCAPISVGTVAPSQVYSQLPYAPGDRAEYAISYMGVSAGYAYLEVHPPLLRDGVWYQAYEADARTGNWYRWVFIGHDSVWSYATPSGLASRYVLDQDEGKMFGWRTRKHTEIQFDQAACVATETIEEADKKPETERVALDAHVLDALLATFRLRALDYRPGSAVQLPLYSSRKTATLEVTGLSQEQVRVPAGVFSTMKLDLRTYLNGVQQAGGLTVWVALEKPEHPLVRIITEVAAGSLLLELSQFKHGTPPPE